MPAFHSSNTAPTPHHAHSPSPAVVVVVLLVLVPFSILLVFCLKLLGFIRLPNLAFHLRRQTHIAAAAAAAAAPAIELDRQPRASINTLTNISTRAMPPTPRPDTRPPPYDYPEQIDNPPPAYTSAPPPSYVSEDEMVQEGDIAEVGSIFDSDTSDLESSVLSLSGSGADSASDTDAASAASSTTVGSSTTTTTTPTFSP